MAFLSTFSPPTQYFLFSLPPRPGPLNVKTTRALQCAGPIKTPAPAAAAAPASIGKLDEERVGGVGSDGEFSAWSNVKQLRWEGDLVVEGDLPLWLDGTYLRNGAGIWDIGDHSFHHLFDGYATLVRVSIRDGRATAAHRQIESEAYKGAVAHNGRSLPEFSSRPRPESLVGYMRELVGLVTGSSLTDNPNISVLALGDGRVMCLNETTRSSVLIDPDTLDTVGKFRYTDNLGAALQSAHPVVIGSEFLTLLPDLLRPGHRVVRMEAGSNERKVIGRVSCRGGPTPGWMHSFAVTENYVVVPEMPFRYFSSSEPRPKDAPSYPFEWLPESGSYMHVMSKATGKTVASVEVEPFWAAHYINAYEEEGDGGVTAVVVDCCEHYGSPAIIETLAMDRLRSLMGQDVLPNARVGRFRIPLDGSPRGELRTAIDPEEHGRAIDMCTINPAYLGKKYRYAYGCGARRPCNFPNTLTKMDFEEKSAKSWHEDGAVPSEPFFVARPAATNEDDGVVISIVSARNGGSYVVVLDAGTFEEIARARFPYGLPYGFHGCWIPRKN